jgi:hypothetical protein
MIKTFIKTLVFAISGILGITIFGTLTLKYLKCVDNWKNCYVCSTNILFSYDI